MKKRHKYAVFSFLYIAFCSFRFSKWVHKWRRWVLDLVLSLDSLLVSDFVVEFFLVHPIFGDNPSQKLQHKLHNQTILFITKSLQMSMNLLSLIISLLIFRWLFHCRWVFLRWWMFLGIEFGRVGVGLGWPCWPKVFLFFLSRARVYTRSFVFFSVTSVTGLRNQGEHSLQLCPTFSGKRGTFSRKCEEFSRGWADSLGEEVDFWRRNGFGDSNVTVVW